MTSCLLVKKAIDSLKYLQYCQYHRMALAALQFVMFVVHASLQMLQASMDYLTGISRPVASCKGLTPHC